MRFSCCPTQFCPLSEFLTQICCHPPNALSRPLFPSSTDKKKNRQRSIVIISSSSIIIIMMSCFALAHRKSITAPRQQSAFSCVFFSFCHRLDPVAHCPFRLLPSHLSAPTPCPSPCHADCQLFSFFIFMRRSSSKLCEQIAGQSSPQTNKTSTSICTSTPVAAYTNTHTHTPTNRDTQA